MKLRTVFRTTGRSCVKTSFVRYIIVPPKWIAARRTPAALQSRPAKSPTEHPQAMLDFGGRLCDTLAGGYILIRLKNVASLCKSLLLAFACLIMQSLSRSSEKVIAPV
ncbi:MAG TPA: hypothetical protein V6C69_01550 [Trichormus sp.]